MHHLKTHRISLLLFSVLFILPADTPAAVNDDQNPSGQVQQTAPRVHNNRVVYHCTDKFCGWPANEGMWQWGDELLVGFEVASYISNEQGHSIDRDSPKAIYFARSLDGGETWLVEKPDEIAPPAYLEDPDRYKQGKYASKVLTEPIRFTHPDFAMKLRSTRFYTSYDRGRNWDGPYDLPDFSQKLIMSRTDYIVLDQHECLILSTASMTDGKYGRTFVARTTNGGLHWNIIGWLTPEDFPPRQYQRFAYSIMPSTVQVDETTLLSALRQRVERRPWLELYVSEDLGRTWESRSEIVDGVNNPPSLVLLDDGRLAVVYCMRGKTPGLRCRLSDDMGKTWSQEYTLRDDALSWDIGYVQSRQRSDGKVVSVYYYHTDQLPEQHIAATIWQP